MRSLGRGKEATRITASEKIGKRDLETAALGLAPSYVD
jgi:hypothetical protein